MEYFLFTKGSQRNPAALFLVHNADIVVSVIVCIVCHYTVVALMVLDAVVDSVCATTIGTAVCKVVLQITVVIYEVAEIVRKILSH